MNSGSDLALTAVLFSLFNGNNTVFVQFRQSTFCRPTTSCHVLLVLFAVTPICCTCCLDKQCDICNVSLHFVLQVIFSPLNMLLIFLQSSWGPFLQCIFYKNIQRKNGWSQHSDQRWRNTMADYQCHVHHHFIIFAIRSRINAIKWCPPSLWTTLIGITLTSFSSHSPKAKFIHAKVTTWSWTHTHHHLSWNSPTIKCGNTKFSFYIITIGLTVISLNFIESTLWFWLHIASYVRVFE